MFFLRNMKVQNIHTIEITKIFYTKIRKRYHYFYIINITYPYKVELMTPVCI
jgi:hypothetical protein